MLPTWILKYLDWPDPRIDHNGGDVMLGVALYQNGFGLHTHYDGVVVNDAPRRGTSQKPAGA